MVFADQDAYQALDATKVAGFEKVPAQKGSVNARFSDLKSGPNTIVAIHDQDKIKT